MTSSSGDTVLDVAETREGNDDEGFLKGARLDGLAVWSAFPDGGVAATLAELGALVAAGRLRTGVSLVVPTSRLPDAMEARIDRHVRGKVVVTWDDSGQTMNPPLV